MQKYHPQILNMQIPQERQFVGLESDKISAKIEKLSEIYEIHRKEEVTTFIKQHEELIAYITKITPIIDRYFPDYKKCIIFYEDFEFEELSNITIYINSSHPTFDSDCEIFKQLEVEILKMKEFSTQIKQLVLINLWLV